MKRFEETKRFNGKTYKLATLSKGMTKTDAKKTAEINRLSGNLYRTVEMNGKYAVYVRKTK